MLLIQLVLLTISSFMHLYFLLKGLIMIIIVVIYVSLSHYWNVYSTIAHQYNLSTSLLMIQTTSEMLFFILLLIGLDRRVRLRECLVNQNRLIDI